MANYCFHAYFERRIRPLERGQCDLLRFIFCQRLCYSDNHAVCPHGGYRCPSKGDICNGLDTAPDLRTGVKTYGKSRRKKGTYFYYWRRFFRGDHDCSLGYMAYEYNNRVQAGVPHSPDPDPLAVFMIAYAF